MFILHNFANENMHISLDLILLVKFIFLVLFWGQIKIMYLIVLGYSGVFFVLVVFFLTFFDTLARFKFFH